MKITGWKSLSFSIQKYIPFYFWQGRWADGLKIIGLAFTEFTE